MNIFYPKSIINTEYKWQKKKKTQNKIAPQKGKQAQPIQNIPLIGRLEALRIDFLDQIINS